LRGAKYLAVAIGDVVVVRIAGGNLTAIWRNNNIRDGCQ